MNQLHPYKSSVSIYRSSRSVSRWSWWFLYASHCFWSVQGARLRQARCCLTGGFMQELERLCNPMYLFLVACLCVYVCVCQHLFYRRCIWNAWSTSWLLKPISLCIWICTVNVLLCPCTTTSWHDGVSHPLRLSIWLSRNINLHEGYSLSLFVIDMCVGAFLFFFLSKLERNRGQNHWFSQHSDVACRI